MTVFWLILFPVLLSTIYHFSMSNLLAGEEFEKIDIAFVENENMPAELRDIMSNSDMFNIKSVNFDEAQNMLSKAQISAFINYNNGVELIVKKDGMSESITKVFLDNYSQITQTIENIIISNPSALQSGVLDKFDLQSSNIDDLPIGNSTNVLVVFFYGILAMACLNAATLGSDAIIAIQANQSYLASRINVAPTHKLKSFLTLIASYLTFHIISTGVTLFYLNKILGIDFGTNIGYVLLICVVASFMGISLGSFISAVVKKSAGFKVGIILTINLFGCFLAGMMSVETKYIVQSNFPALAYINPANLVTDGLYSLYYYNTLDRYFVNLGILSVYALIFCTLTYLIIRRQKYESI
jgi:ABC-2 type transport system permease protein